MRNTVCFLLLGCVVLAAGCGNSGTEAVRIGVIAELTGDIPATGASCRNAAEMAVAEANAAGGITLGGRRFPVEICVEDNANKAEQSAAAAQKLVTQENVIAVIGPNASRGAIPAAEICESMQVPFMTPWSTNPKTTLDARTSQPKRFAFRACFIDPFQGRVLAKFVREQLRFTRAAVLYDVASDYNKGIAEFFRQTFTAAGGTLVAFESYTTGDKDFSAQLTKIKAASPEVLFLPNYYNEVPLQVQQAQRLGLNVPVIGGDAWGNPELVTLAGRAVENCYFSTHYSAEASTPAAQKFITAYTAKFGVVPDDVAALTYDAFGLVLQAVAAAGRLDRMAVRDALASITSFDGVTGTMQFQPGSGDPVKSAVILQVRDGKFAWFANAQP